MSTAASSKQQVVSKITKFTDLVTWQKAHKLVVHTYELTRMLPTEEQFGLVSQMRRAAVSITSNIAEGFSRRTQKDKVHFYQMSHGSLTELQNQILIAKDVGYIQDIESIATETVEVHKLITGLIKSMTDKE